MAHEATSQVKEAIAETQEQVKAVINETEERLKLKHKN